MTMAALILDPAHRGPAARPELDRMIAGIDREQSVVVIGQIACAALFPDRLAECRAALERCVTLERDGTDTTQATSVRGLLAYDAYASGRSTRALTLIAEIEEMVKATEAGMQQALAGTLGGLIAAATGDASEVRRWTQIMDNWGRVSGGAGDRHRRDVVLTHQAIAGGDFERAFALATAISPEGQLPHLATALWTAFDLIESAVRVGRPDVARRHVAALRRLGVTRLAPRPRRHLRPIAYG